MIFVLLYSKLSYVVCSSILHNSKRDMSHNAILQGYKLSYELSYEVSVSINDFFQYCTTISK